MAVNSRSDRTRIAVRSQSVKDAGTKVKAVSERSFHRSRAAQYSSQGIGKKATTKTSRKATDTIAQTAEKATEATGKTAEKAAEATAKAAEKAAETVAKTAEKAAETGIRAGSAVATAGTSEAVHAIKAGFKVVKKTFDVSKKGLEKATDSPKEGSKGGSKSGGMTVSEQNANLTSHKSAKTGTKLLAFFTPLVGAMLLPVIITVFLTLMIITVVLAPIISAVGGSIEAHPEVPPVSTEAFAKISEEMLKYEGIPYVWGGSSPEAGFDCSGMVQYVYRNALGVELHMH